MPLKIKMSFQEKKNLSITGESLFCHHTLSVRHGSNSKYLVPNGREDKDHKTSTSMYSSLTRSYRIPQEQLLLFAV